jgi:hypothetical protein
MRESTWRPGNDEPSSEEGETVSDTELHDQIILIAREWAQEYKVGDEKARILIDRIWPAIEKVVSIIPGVRGEGSSGPTKE